MSKQPIAWHEQCLKNLCTSWERAAARAVAAQAEADRIYQQVLLLDHQLTVAKAQGKDGFDPDRFAVK
jgi:hypothetical protein